MATHAKHLFHQYLHPAKLSPFVTTLCALLRMQGASLSTASGLAAAKHFLAEELQFSLDISTPREKPTWLTQPVLGGVAVPLNYIHG